MVVDSTVGVLGTRDANLTLGLLPFYLVVSKAMVCERFYASKTINDIVCVAFTISDVELVFL